MHLWWRRVAGAVAAIILTVAPEGAAKQKVGGGNPADSRVPAGTCSVVGEHEKAVTAISLSPDGRSLASTSSDATARLWDVSTRKERFRVEALETTSAVAFSPNGQVLAVGGDTKNFLNPDEPRILMFEVADGKRIRSLNGFIGTVTSMAFSPDGKTFAAAQQQAFGVWPTHDWGAFAKFEERKRTAGVEIRNLSYSRTGQLAFVDGWRNGFWFARQQDDQTISVASPEVEPVRQWEGASAFAFSPDGKSAVVGDSAGNLSLVNLSTRAVQEILRAHSGRVTAVAYGPDGTLIASAGENQRDRINFWRVGDGKKAGSISNDWSSQPGEMGHVTSVAFTNDGKLVAGGTDGAIRLCD